MKAAIFTLDTESYKARKASAAGMVLKKLLEPVSYTHLTLPTKA